MLCPNSVALSCVAIEKAMHARQIRSGAHERGILSRKTSYSGKKKKKKKKKGPLSLGRHSIVSEPRFINT